MIVAQVGLLGLSAGRDMVLFLIDQMKQVNSCNEMIMVTALQTLFPLLVLLYYTTIISCVIYVSADAVAVSTVLCFMLVMME